MADTMQYPRGSQFSFGIDENTALVVTGSWLPQRQGEEQSQGGRSGEVLGESGVTLFDMTQAEVELEGEGEGEGREVWRAAGVLVSHLTRGDVVDLQSYRVMPAPFKSPLVVSDFSPRPPPMLVHDMTSATETHIDTHGHTDTDTKHTPTLH